MNSTVQHPKRLRSFDRCQVPTPWPIKWVLKRSWAPTAMEYQALKAGMWAGDEPMDVFVESAYASGQAATHWKLLKQATQARDGGDWDSLPMPLKALLLSASSPPFAIDYDLVQEGILFTHRVGRLAMYVLRDMALMGGYLLSAFNQTLILTGDLEKGAASRLSNTSNWWLSVTECVNSNQVGQSGFASTLNVRWVHAMVRRHIQSHPKWDGSVYGLPINQVDMAATYLGFSVVLLLGLRLSGVLVSRDESRAVMHLWKWIAWQMGVEAQWLVDTEEQAIVKLKQFTMTHTPADHSSKQLAMALAKEPLSREFERWTSLQRRWAYYTHLSTNSYLLGGRTMKTLGLKSPVGPLLAPLHIAPRTWAYYQSRLNNRALNDQAQRGRAEQHAAAAEIAGNPALVKQSSHPVHQ